MSIKNLYIDVPGTGFEDVLGVEVTEGYKQPCARFSIETRSYGDYGLNDYLPINIGYDTSHAQIMYGFIDNITGTRRPGVYEVTGRDVLKRAIDHYIVTIDIENPWSRSNIKAEDLVRDLLLEAGITGYSGSPSAFTFGVSCPAEFNLISSMDAIERICNIIAWRCYAKDGTVYFQNIQPAPSGAPTHYFTTGSSGNIISIQHEQSTDNLRNKVVVFGRDGIYAEASAVSPYLPTGFYKTAIVSSELIDSQSMADDAATYNLNLYNRLTETCKIDVEGDATIRARTTVNVVESFTGISEDWFVYSLTHRFDNSGYFCSLHLTK